jgi:hypothetical protein
VRFCFASLKVNERYGDVSPIICKLLSTLEWPGAGACPNNDRIVYSRCGTAFSIGCPFHGMGWYAIAANYDYGALAGVYVLDHNDERCILDLRSDRGFTEERVHSGDIQRAAGTWRRDGQSHIPFLA